MSEAATPPDQVVAQDKLEGVQAIADFLGWPPRKVYRAREEGWTTPIRKRDGLGIYAFKSELRDWLLDDATLPRRKVA